MEQKKLHVGLTDAQVLESRKRMEQIFLPRQKKIRGGKNFLKNFQTR